MQRQPFTPAQLALLARGAVRLDGAIPPIVTDLPEQIRSSDVAAAQLIKKKLAQWIDVIDASLAWKVRTGQAIGLVITDLGRAALEAIETEIADMGPAASKIGHVIERLRSPGGISLAEISVATGWQPHSARAALTTLRRKGFCIDRTPDDAGTGSRYRIAEEAAQ